MIALIPFDFSEFFLKTWMLASDPSVKLLDPALDLTPLRGSSSG
jgi:hypothetical protein